ncbi:unnamed protein product [Ceutorhynchus assimilis]|uniref:RHD domain-containing protein n=1 Tax=Ceutorhynchus assimilis TaxID=467358 RepID=A0A9N9QPQ8_9CUCU|nr:unnamed protein product [Ceutorhynchus assimilis]
MNELPDDSTGLINPLQIINSASVKNIVPSMATFPTPPSSSGDSPQPVYFVSSPGSSNFSVPSPGTSQSYFHAHVLSAEGNMMETDNKDAPYLRFIEQPTNKFRFRYKSEMAGTHGSLSGMNSDKSRKQTYPTVELVNCPENAEVRCSIYQFNIDEDFKPHPHKLIMKKGKNEMEDPHDLQVGPEEGFIATFHSMGIIHTARKNIVGELVRKKEQLKKELNARLEGILRDLTPKESAEIKALAEHESKTINLNIVRLRFDAYIVKNGIRNPICPPIFSHGINNLKCALTGDLKIVRMDHCSSKAKGGQEIFLLVERVTKKNIRIRFFELDDDEQEVWEGDGKFSELDVHHQYAIVFRTPAYRDQDITGPVQVYMELVRPSDSARSEMREFRYIPNNDYKTGYKRPRSCLDSSSSYDSKSVNSKELPVTITAAVQTQNMFALPNANSWNQQPPLTDDQLNTAMNDFNSDEFKLLFERVASELPNDLIRPEVIAKDGILPYQFNNMRIGARPPTNIQRHTSLAAQQTDSTVVKMEVTPEDFAKAQKTYDELRSFAKSKESQTRTALMLAHHLDANNEQPRQNNALHVFIALNKKAEVSFILKMLLLSKQLHLANVVNADDLTPLHIAVMCRNEEFVGYLRRVNADPTKQNSLGRTPLHEAVKSAATLKMFELLLSFKNTKIDLEDYDGSTALTLAIETANMTAIKVLCDAGADINRQHCKDGHTPFRMAVEHDFAEAVKYFLKHPSFDFEAQKDFQNVSAFQAAVLKPSSDEIMGCILKLAAANKIDLELKREIEDDDDIEEIQEIIDIKPDTDTIPDDPTLLYAGLKTLTPKCLDEIASYLDKGEKYMHLAELFDFAHLLQTPMFQNGESISKNILRHASESEGGLLMLREFLNLLEEPLAVAAMDHMARERF